MPRMVRKQVYLEKAQDEMLKRKAHESGRTEAEIIRVGLDLLFKGAGVIGEAVGQSSLRIAEAPGTYVAERESAVAERVKRSIESALAAAEERAGVEDMSAWAAERAFMELRAKLVVPKDAEAGGRGWTRGDLYEERLKKWTK